jgi:hypothetical protein
MRSLRGVAHRSHLPGYATFDPCTPGYYMQVSDDSDLLRNLNAALLGNIAAATATSRPLQRKFSTSSTIEVTRSRQASRTGTTTFLGIAPKTCVECTEA